MNTYPNLELISVHIPKCGGTTFSVILGMIYEDKYSHVTDISQLNNINADIRCMHGHYHLNTEWLKIYPNTKVCVWIRNPVDRIISYYFYWATYKFPPGTSPNKRHQDLIEKRYGLIEFAGKSWMKNRMFDYIENIPLSNIDFIGDISNYDSDLRRLSRLMNWDDSLIQTYQTLNESEYQRKVFDREFKVTEKDREELADILDQDMRRYEHIKNYKIFTNNSYRYATCREKRDWDKIVEEKSYLPP